jgi:hypothetical protein
MTWGRYYVNSEKIPLSLVGLQFTIASFASHEIRL